MAKAKKPKSTSASTWKKRFEQRQQKQQKLFEEAQKHYDIMYAVQNTSKISPWKSKVYVPVLASKAWELIARMSDVVPLFNVTIKNELDISDETFDFVVPQVTLDRQKRIEAKLAYDYACGGSQPMKLRVFDPLVDAVVAGTGYAYAPWVFEEKKSYARKFDAAGNMDNTQRIAKTTQTGHNGFEGVNFFNVFVADAPDFWSAPYVIVRGRKPLVDMEKSGRYVDLDKCNTTAKENEFDRFNESRNRVVNESESVEIDDTVDMVTYYECYERTAEGIQMTTYAEGSKTETGDNGPWIEIREPANPYWHDMFPIVPFYCRKKSFSAFGESLFENNRTMQSATNDLFNHYLDNWNLSVESMIMYEDGSLTNDFVIEPGGEITYTGEKPTQFKFPEPNPQQLSIVMQTLEKGIDAATFSPYAAGTPDDSSDKTQGTAYGVKSITEAATTKIGFFRDNFKQSMKVVGKIWLSNLQQFADDPEEIRRIKNGQEMPDVVMPSDYQGEMELDIDDDSMTPISKEQKRAMHQELLGSLKATQDMAIQQAGLFKSPTDIPRYNFHEINQDTAELYSKKDFNRYLLDHNVEIAPEPEQDDTREFLNINYKDAPPDIKAQIEEKYGLQPSSMHDTALMGEAMAAGATQAQYENGDLDGTRLNAPAPGPGTPDPAVAA